MAINPYEPPVAGLPTRFLQHHLLLRLMLCVAGTTGVTMTLLMMLPPGFDGVPYMLLVLAIFVMAFLIVAVLERSSWINVVSVATFWLCISALHVTDLGTAPMQKQRLLEGLLWIALVASTHAALQLLVHFWIGGWRGNGNRRSPDAAANSELHESNGLRRQGVRDLLSRQSTEAES